MVCEYTQKMRLCGNGAERNLSDMFDMNSQKYDG